MWTWVQMMGLRKFQEMVFTGGRSPPPRCTTATSSTRWWRAISSRPRSTKYARACSRNRPVDTVFQQKMFFEIYKQHQGEYMGSLLSAFFESMGSGVANDDTDDLDMMKPSTAGCPARSTTTTASSRRTSG